MCSLTRTRVVRPRSETEGSLRRSPKVTVIVPVCNTVSYLGQCLDSIAGQTLQEIEVICVDDGSTDGSFAVLQRYAALDSRFIVLHQENGYAGTARNRAMRIAQGDYLVFWDSDDFFEPEALEKMYDRITCRDADICVCGAYQYFERTGETSVSSRYLAQDRLPKDPVFNLHTHGDFIFTFTTVMLWNKMYRRAFVEETGLAFQSRRNANDTYFSACALLLADRIVVVKEPLVTYRIGREGSLVSSLQKDPIAPLEAWADVRRDMAAIVDFPEYDYWFKVLSVLRHTKHHLGRKAWRGVFRQAKSSGLIDRLGISGKSVRSYLSFVRWAIRRRP